MAAPKKTKKQTHQNESFLSKFNLEEILPQKYHVLAVVLVIIILFLIFLNPMYFGGKTFQSGDIIAIESSKPYIEKDREGFSLWDPYVFCGVPAYAIATEKTWFNLIYMGFTELRLLFASFFSVNYAMWTFFLIILGITSFFLMKYLTKNTLISLFTAAATAFSTGLIVFLFIGHVTKLMSLCMYPLLFLLLLRLKEKIRIIDILLLIITLQIFLHGFHVQIIFYTLMAVGIYFIYYFLRSFAKKDEQLRTGILKSAGVFILAVIFATLIQADNLTQIYEYTPYSTRGAKSLTELETGKQEQSTSDYYKYHTDWSFSPGEVLTFIVPSYYGFGNTTYKGPLTNEEEVEVNTYFGQMPFVDVAMYMGVLVFFLGLFGMITTWKDPFVRFLTILSAIALLISFGSNFPVLFDILFYNLPYFDKFRVPSMILVLVQLSFPVLAGYGLMKIISLRNEKDLRAENLVKYGAYVFSGLFIISLLLSSSINSWMVSRVNEYASSIQAARAQYAQQYTALAPFIAEMFSGDLLIALGFSAVVFWGAYMYVNRKLSADIFILLVIILSLVDLWRIDSRGAKYIENPDIKNLFNEPSYVTAIKNQKDTEPFRLLNIKQDRTLGSLSNNGNFHAYFLLEDFFGYSGIKPRAYQDIIDIVGPINLTLWQMCNVKYIVSGQQIPFPGFTPILNEKDNIVYKNDNALPRIYFVDSVEKKESFEVLNLIKNNAFNPKNKAFVQDAEVKADKPDSTAGIKLTRYFEGIVEAEVTASGNNFIFFGNSYIPSGWKCYVDGNETPLFRTNHHFMGAVIPKGDHKIKFEYLPKSFVISKYIALILSASVLLGLLMVLVMQYKDKKKI